MLLIWSMALGMHYVMSTGLLRDVEERLNKIPGEETYMQKTMYCFLSVLVILAANSAQAACTTTGDANNQRIICTNYQHSVNGVPQNDSAPPVDLSQLDSQLRSSFPPSFSQPMPSFSGLDLSSIFGK